MKIMRVNKSHWAKSFANMMPENRRFQYTRQELEQYCQEHLEDDDHIFLQSWENLGNGPELTGVLIAEDGQLPNACSVAFISAKTQNASKRLIKEIICLAHARGKEYIWYTTHRNPKAMRKLFGGNILCTMIGGTLEQCMEDYGISDIDK